LVGATRAFVMKPFLIKALFHGFLAGAIACTLVYAALYITENYLLHTTLAMDVMMWGILCAVLITLGVFISFISTFFAVSKWLSKRSYELF
jgi:cell division transport system permease protein